jgi:hypothetical protein
MSVQSEDRLSRILLCGGNVAIYGDPRTWKSTFLSQLDFHEEIDIDHRIVICPNAKMGGWVLHYEHIRALRPNIFVTFVAIEDLLNSDDPEGDFDALFTQKGRKRIIMDDLEGFHSRKLGRLNFENTLVEKLVLTESLGIEVWEIFHSLKSSKLRPHFKTIFFSGSFATQANFDILKKFIAAKVPLASCQRFVEFLWVKQEMSQYGINTAGEAVVVGTADGFLTPKDPDCRFFKREDVDPCHITSTPTSKARAGWSMLAAWIRWYCNMAQSAGWGGVLEAHCWVCTVQ